MPTEYEFMKCARLRGLDSGKSFKRLEAGFKGEEKFYRYLRGFCPKHWTILRNTWLKDDSAFECDLVLIAGHAVYVFEVKNYFGRFVYENGQCYSRGVAITYNPINQARNAKLHLQRLLRPYTVRGALVFIGEHNAVSVKDAVADIDVLEANEVYEFVQVIKQEEAQYTGRPVDAEAVVAQLERFAIDPPHLPDAYTREEMAKAVTGIFCANCCEKVAVKRDKYISCACGLRESKEEAIVRTACEYGVLTYGRDFTVSDIQGILGRGISYNYLKKVLDNHFTQALDAKVLTYINPNREFSIIAHEFEFNLPKMMIY